MKQHYQKCLHRSAIVAVGVFSALLTMQAETVQKPIGGTSVVSLSASTAGTAASLVSQPELTRGREAVEETSVEAPAVVTTSQKPTVQTTSASALALTLTQASFKAVSQNYQACASDPSCQGSPKFNQLSLGELAVLGAQTQNASAFLNTAFTACMLSSGCQVTESMRQEAQSLIQNYPLKGAVLNDKQAQAAKNIGEALIESTEDPATVKQLNVNPADLVAYNEGFFGNTALVNSRITLAIQKNHNGSLGDQIGNNGSLPFDTQSLQDLKNALPAGQQAQYADLFTALSIPGKESQNIALNAWIQKHSNQDPGLIAVSLSVGGVPDYTRGLTAISLMVREVLLNCPKCQPGISAWMKDSAHILGVGQIYQTLSNLGYLDSMMVGTSKWFSDNNTNAPGGGAYAYFGGGNFDYKWHVPSSGAAYGSVTAIGASALRRFFFDPLANPVYEERDFTKTINSAMFGSQIMLAKQAWLTANRLSAEGVTSGLFTPALGKDAQGVSLFPVDGPIHAALDRYQRNFGVDEGQNLIQAIRQVYPELAASPKDTSPEGIVGYVMYALYKQGPAGQAVVTQFIHQPTQISSKEMSNYLAHGILNSDLTGVTLKAKAFNPHTKDVYTKTNQQMTKSKQLLDDMHSASGSWNIQSYLVALGVNGTFDRADFKTFLRNSNPAEFKNMLSNLQGGVGKFINHSYSKKTSAQIESKFNDPDSQRILSPTAWVLSSDGQVHDETTDVVDMTEAFGDIYPNATPVIAWLKGNHPELGLKQPLDLTKPFSKKASQALIDLFVKTFGPLPALENDTEKDIPNPSKREKALQDDWRGIMHDVGILPLFAGLMIAKFSDPKASENKAPDQKVQVLEAGLTQWIDSYSLTKPGKKFVKAMKQFEGAQSEYIQNQIILNFSQLASNRSDYRLQSVDQQRGLDLQPVPGAQSDLGFLPQTFDGQTMALDTTQLTSILGKSFDPSSQVVQDLNSAFQAVIQTDPSSLKDQTNLQDQINPLLKTLFTEGVMPQVDNQKKYLKKFNSVLSENKINPSVLMGSLLFYQSLKQNTPAGDVALKQFMTLNPVMAGRYLSVLQDQLKLPSIKQDLARLDTLQVPSIDTAFLPTTAGQVDTQSFVIGLVTQAATDPSVHRDFVPGVLDDVTQYYQSAGDNKTQDQQATFQKLNQDIGQSSFVQHLNLFNSSLKQLDLDPSAQNKLQSASDQVVTDLMGYSDELKTAIQKARDTQSPIDSTALAKALLFYLSTKAAPSSDIYTGAVVFASSQSATTQGYLSTLKQIGLSTTEFENKLHWTPPGPQKAKTLQSVVKDAFKNAQRVMQKGGEAVIDVLGSDPEFSALAKAYKLNPSAQVNEAIYSMLKTRVTVDHNMKSQVDSSEYLAIAYLMNKGTQDQKQSMNAVLQNSNYTGLQKVEVKMHDLNIIGLGDGVSTKVMLGNSTLYDQAWSAWTLEHESELDKFTESFVNAFKQLGTIFTDPKSFFSQFATAKGWANFITNILVNIGLSAIPGVGPALMVGVGPLLSGVASDLINGQPIDVAELFGSSLAGSIQFAAMEGVNSGLEFEGKVDFKEGGVQNIASNLSKNFATNATKTSIGLLYHSLLIATNPTMAVFSMIGSGVKGPEAEETAVEKIPENSSVVSAPETPASSPVITTDPVAPVQAMEPVIPASVTIIQPEAPAENIAVDTSQNPLARVKSSRERRVGFGDSSIQTVNTQNDFLPNATVDQAQALIEQKKPPLKSALRKSPTRFAEPTSGEQSLETQAESLQNTSEISNTLAKRPELEETHNPDQALLKQLSSALNSLGDQVENLKNGNDILTWEGQTIKINGLTEGQLKLLRSELSSLKNMTSVKQLLMNLDELNDTNILIVLSRLMDQGDLNLKDYSQFIQDQGLKSVAAAQKVLRVLDDQKTFEAEHPNLGPTELQQHRIELVNGFGDMLYKGRSLSTFFEKMCLNLQECSGAKDEWTKALRNEPSEVRNQEAVTSKKIQEDRIAKIKETLKNAPVKNIADLMRIYTESVKLNPGKLLAADDFEKLIQKAMSEDPANNTLNPQMEKSLEQFKALTEAVNSNMKDAQNLFENQENILSDKNSAEDIVDAKVRWNNEALSSYLKQFCRSPSCTESVLEGKLKVLQKSAEIVMKSDKNLDRFVTLMDFINTNKSKSEFNSEQIQEVADLVTQRDGDVSGSIKQGERGKTYRLYLGVKENHFESTFGQLLETSITSKDDGLPGQFRNAVEILKNPTLVPPETAEFGNTYNRLVDRMSQALKLKGSLAINLNATQSLLEQFKKIPGDQQTAAIEHLNQFFQQMSQRDPASAFQLLEKMDKTSGFSEAQKQTLVAKFSPVLVKAIGEKITPESLAKPETLSDVANWINQVQGSAAFSEAQKSALISDDNLKTIINAVQREVTLKQEGTGGHVALQIQYLLEGVKETPSTKVFRADLLSQFSKAYWEFPTTAQIFISAVKILEEAPQTRKFKTIYDSLTRLLPVFETMEIDGKIPDYTEERNLIQDMRSKFSFGSVYGPSNWSWVKAIFGSRSKETPAVLENPPMTKEAVVMPTASDANGAISVENMAIKSKEISQKFESLKDQPFAQLLNVIKLEKTESPETVAQGLNLATSKGIQFELLKAGQSDQAAGRVLGAQDSEFTTVFQKLLSTASSKQDLTDAFQVFQAYFLPTDPEYNSLLEAFANQISKSNDTASLNRLGKEVLRLQGVQASTEPVPAQNRAAFPKVVLSDAPALVESSSPPLQEVPESLVPNNGPVVQPPEEIARNNATGVETLGLLAPKEVPENSIPGPAAARTMTSESIKTVVRDVPDANAPPTSGLDAKEIPSQISSSKLSAQDRDTLAQKATQVQQELLLNQVKTPLTEKLADPSLNKANRQKIIVETQSAFTKLAQDPNISTKSIVTMLETLKSLPKNGKSVAILEALGDRINGISGDDTNRPEAVKLYEENALRLHWARVRRNWTAPFVGTWRFMSKPFLATKPLEIETSSQTLENLKDVVIPEDSQASVKQRANEIVVKLQAQKNEPFQQLRNLLNLKGAESDKVVSAVNERMLDHSNRADGFVTQGLDISSSEGGDLTKRQFINSFQKKLNALPSDPDPVQLTNTINELGAAIQVSKAVLPENTAISQALSDKASDVFLNELKKGGIPSQELLDLFNTVPLSSEKLALFVNDGAQLKLVIKFLRQTARFEKSPELDAQLLEAVHKKMGIEYKASGNAELNRWLKASQAKFMAEALQSSSTDRGLANGPDLAPEQAPLSDSSADLFASAQNIDQGRQAVLVSLREQMKTQPEVVLAKIRQLLMMPETPNTSAFRKQLFNEFVAVYDLKPKMNVAELKTSLEILKQAPQESRFFQIYSKILDKVVDLKIDFPKEDYTQINALIQENNPRLSSAAWKDLRIEKLGSRNYQGHDSLPVVKDNMEFVGPDEEAQPESSATVTDPESEFVKSFGKLISKSESKAELKSAFRVFKEFFSPNVNMNMESYNTVLDALSNRFYELEGGTEVPNTANSVNHKRFQNTLEEIKAKITNVNLNPLPAESSTQKTMGPGGQFFAGGIYLN